MEDKSLHEFEEDVVVVSLFEILSSSNTAHQEKYLLSIARQSTLEYDAHNEHIVLLSKLIKQKEPIIPNDRLSSFTQSLVYYIPSLSYYTNSSLEPLEQESEMVLTIKAIKNPPTSKSILSFSINEKNKCISIRTNANQVSSMYITIPADTSCRLNSNGPVVLKTSYGTITGRAESIYRNIGQKTESTSVIKPAQTIKLAINTTEQLPDWPMPYFIINTTDKLIISSYKEN